ncbi:DNA ligase 1-like [Diachasma alloeum]|uniref:DNA ligase 1-like n=1 Tax=Diachasma alloeum TaxID=454923 RepID=UPI00073812F2|nr:DNA ligase 1-like [Diachasma alloeum]
MMDIKVNTQNEDKQQDNVAQKTGPSDEVTLKKMWDRHEQLIADLITYMKEKRSINAHCRERARRERSLKAPRPRWTRSWRETALLSDNKSSKMKRKSRDSPPTDTRDLKKKEDEMKAAHAPNKKEDGLANSSKWEQVKPKKKRQKTQPPEKRKEKEKKKQWAAVMRPNALIVHPKDKQQYSQVLK